MTKPKPNRIVAIVCALLAGVVLVGGVDVRLRPCWAARYLSEEADLRGVVLIGALLVPKEQVRADSWNARLRPVRRVEEGIQQGVSLSVG
jgi:hypothetical protein